MDKDHLSEKSNSSKSKNSNHKSKKKGYTEMENESRKKKYKNNNEISSYEDNTTNSKSKKYKNHDFYEVPNNCVKEEYPRKEERSKNKKINSKNKKNSTDSNYSEESKKSIKKLSKLRKIIKKINAINTLNLINEYYQRWILQTFDVVEEDSEAMDDPDKKEDKEVEEEEEEEENDYGGDLEEIEERAADEEESVITSVQSKTKIKRANDILFALRKIIKYKNTFFRYFIRWYNAVDINAPTNEYKKIRKEKKLSNSVAGSKKNVNSNLNYSELKRPIYELTTEDELKSEVKVNLKNIIELKGNKKNILKKYYDIWFNLTFNYNNNSTNSINNEQNEYIFTYHGNRNRNNNVNEYNNNNNSNTNNYDNTKKDKETEAYINQNQKNKDNLKKENSNTKCYVKKKVPSMKKENTVNEIKKKSSKKKNKIPDMIKNLLIKVNNKKLLYTALMIWKKNIKKKSNKTKRKNSSSKTKKSSQLMKYNSKESDSTTEEKEKEHRKNCFSIDGGNMNKILNLQKINAFGDDNHLLAESYQINQTNFHDENNVYHLQSDNSINSLNVNSKSTNDMPLIKSKESKKNKKTLKKEDSKKNIKSKDKKSDSSQISQTDDMSEEDIDKIKKKVGKICRIHRNQRAQRYLLIKPPKKARKTYQDKIKEDRQSFSTINHSLRFEKFQKKLYKLILKNTCRKEPLMNSFDNWFNKTFNSENYIPFLRKDLSKSNNTMIKVNRKTSKAKKGKKSKKTEDDQKNKSIDTSGDNIPKNDIAISSLKDSFNSLSQDNNIKSNLIYAMNNENTGSKTYREGAKGSQIKDILNQDADSESSDNRLLFNEKKKNAGGEPFDIPRKRSVGSNKKYQKNKTGDKSTKTKDKESKKNKEKNTKKENEAKIEESPRQRKPGKKVQFLPEYNNVDSSENEKTKNNYANAGRDSVLMLDNLDKNIVNNKASKKKKKRPDLSASVDVVLKKKKKSNKDIPNSSNVRQKSKDDYNRRINITEINDYFTYNYLKEEDINPDVVNIEITQEDDSENEKKHKKNKKSKNNGEKDKKEERRKARLIKVYNRALHLLRKAIRSYKKRNKTFNPDYELKYAFNLWAILTINSNTNDNKDNAGNNKEEDNNKEEENIEEKRINALKEIINIINAHNKKIKGRLSEDEENYNYIKWCYNKWIQNMVKLRENDSNQRLIDKSKSNDLNNNNYTASEKESEKNENLYDYKSPLNKLNSLKIGSDDNSSFIEKKESIKNENNKEKKNKKIESESLLDIELEDKKAHKHKTKKKKNYKNYHSNITSLNNSNKKEGRCSKEDISKDLDIITKNILKNIDDSKNNKNKNEKESENDDFSKKSSKTEEKMKNQESIFQKIRKEFPIGDEGDINTDYIKETKLDEEQRKQEESGVPMKVQPPPQVLALMKKKGTFNLPLPQNNQPLSFREFGKGNLEIVEPGELVSSARLKLVKNNLKRNFTTDSNKLNKDNLDQNNNFNRNSFRLPSAKKYKEEIFPKLKNIFKKKNDGLFDKKKYFNIWCKILRNMKKKEMNLSIPPIVKKTKYTPVIFLTKSIEDNNEEETSITNDNNNEENNMNKEMNKENIMKNNNSNSFDKNKVIEDIDNNKIINNKNNNNNIIENKEDNEINSNNKKIRNEVENQNEEIKFLDKKETILKPLIKETKENDNIKKIFNSTQKINKAQTQIFNIMKYSPLINSNNNKDLDIIANDYLKLLDDYNKKIKIYQLYMLYKMFNDNNDYYLKRNAFNKWKKNNLIFVKSNNDKHIKTYNNHCFSCNCQDEEKNNFEGQIMCLNCKCDKIRRNLKKILIKHKFLKELNPIRYYLLLWYKNIFLSR